MRKLLLPLSIIISFLILFNCDTTSNDSNSMVGSTPTLSLTGADTVVLNEGETYIDSGYTALDSEDGLLTDSVIVSYYKNDKKNVASLDDLSDSAGTYWVKYVVTDSDNNTTIKWRCLIVEENSGTGYKPTIVLTGDDTVLVNNYSSYLEPGYLCIDTEDGDLGDSVKVKWYESDKSNEFDTGSVYPDNIAFIKYYVTDSHGNYVEAWRCIKFNSIPISEQMNGLWEVTGVFDESDTSVNLLDTLLLGYGSTKVPLYANLNNSYDQFEGTMGPLLLYLMFGKNNWTTFFGKLDQIFDYVDSQFFTGGEWGIPDSGNPLAVKGKIMPPSMTTFAEILDLIPGINTSGLYKYLISQFNGVEVEMISESVMEWHFTDETTSIYYTQNNMLENELWTGWSSAAFSRCRIVFKKCTGTLSQKMEELR